MILLYIPVAFLCIFQTQARIIPSFVNVIRRGYENCHIHLIEFPSLQIEESILDFPIFLWLYGLESFLNIQKPERLDYWIARKEYCELIIVLNAPSLAHLDYVLQLYRYVGMCNGISIHCYTRGRYIVSGHDLRYGLVNPLPFPKDSLRDTFWNQRIVLYQFTIFQTHIQIQIGIDLPCKSTVRGTIRPDHFKISNTRKIFNQLQSILLSEKCEFVFWLTGRQHKLYGNDPEFMEHSHGKPTFRRIADYVFTNIKKVFKKNESVDFPYVMEFFDPFNTVGSILATAECDATNPIISFVCRATIDNEETFVFYTKDISYNFLTCADGVIDTSYNAFIQPFDMVVWISIVVTFIVLGVFLDRVHNSISFSITVVWLLMILLQQSISITRKLNYSSCFKIIATAFLCSSLVLINSYRGKITTELTKPKPKPHLEFIQEVFDLGAKIVLPVNLDTTWLDKAVNELHKDWPEKQQHYHWITYVYYEIPLTHKIVDDYYSDNSGENKSKIIYQGFIQHLFFKPFERVPHNYSYTTELQKCNKTAYVATQAEIEEKLVELSRSNSTKKFYLGKDKVYQTKRYWSISTVYWDRFGQMGMQFHHFFQSGIISFIENIYERVIRRKVGKILRTETFGPLNLEGKIGSLFIIYIWFTLICILFFIAERTFSQCMNINLSLSRRTITQDIRGMPLHLL